ncbi:MAG: PD-(D/E)XK nuclease family protein [Planctomycetota bacterium]
MSPRKREADAATGMLPFDAPAAPPTPRVRRVFLGWDRPPLAAAAEWLLREREADLGELLIALPGGRARRRLGELLARGATAGWRPPRLVTQGELVDELLQLERPAAGRLARTLAWRHALEALPARDLERIARGATERRDTEARLRLADTVRTLHGLLAPEGLDFDALVDAGSGPEQEDERSRWAALARAQATYREVLAREDLVDPHEGRRAAIDAGRIRRDRDVVLVGVADMNHLLARTLAELDERATALVAAPAELADGFDAAGRLFPAFWSTRDVPLDVERWHVEEKPSDQADRISTLLAGWSERYAAEEITIGLADDEVAPYLERRLRAAGARMRNAAGTPLVRTRPYRVLAAAARFLERRGFPELATLVRHPDLAPLVADEDAKRDPAEVLDRYHEEHLPHGPSEDWPGAPADTRGVRELHERLVALLGALAGKRKAELGAWAEATRELLGTVYGAAPLDPEVEDERVLAGAITRLAEGIEELAAVPAGLVGGKLLAHEALALLLRQLRGASVAPAPARPEEPTVEALGWLELALDDAPALVVAGFNEGRVPESVQGDAFLPDALRTKLGLPDNDARLARDVYATTVLLSARPDAALVTGRRARDGDPLVPSRIAFHAPEDEVAERVRRFLPPETRPEPARDEGADPVAPLPRLRETPRVDRMSVTSFGDYLTSPYLFYLRRVLRLRTRDDSARELDPLRFGNFGHAVLQAFGESEVRDSPLADVIEDFLSQKADDLARATFGKTPLPAVALQLEQLKYRLRRFAQVQAWRAAKGWRVQAVEWRPDEGVPFDVDGEAIRITGRIDRIDVHPDEGWAILDYKTSEAGADPAKTARGRDGTWRNLQLPLYRLLAEPLARQHGLEGTPQVGYVTIAREAEDIAFKLVDGWTDADFEDAYSAAADVVRKVRRGEFFELGGYVPSEPVLRALFGEGLLHRPAEGGVA